VTKAEDWTEEVKRLMSRKKGIGNAVLSRKGGYSLKRATRKAQRRQFHECMNARVMT